MSRLALGTVQFGIPYGISNSNGKVDFTTAKLMLEVAQSNGIDTLDTAIAYGESEEVLGKIGVEEFKLITKLPYLNQGQTFSEIWIRREFESSLRKLKVNKIYGLMLHQSEVLLGPEGHMIYEALDKLKQEGKVEKIGISAYKSKEVLNIINSFDVDIIQMPFNLLDTRLFSTGLLSELKKREIEIHVRSVFLQGLLLMQQGKIPSKFSAWSNIWAHWHAWLESSNITAVQACLSYVHAFPEIDKVVIGAESVLQLEEIIYATNNLLPLESLPELTCSNDENLINPTNWPKL